MSSNKTNGSTIDLETAISWTSKFREDYPNDFKAFSISKDIINQILDQDDCTGLRFYQAVNDEGEKTLIAVGVDANNEDQYNEAIANRFHKCPFDCSIESPLNK